MSRRALALAPRPHSKPPVSSRSVRSCDRTAAPPRRDRGRRPDLVHREVTHQRGQQRLPAAAQPVRLGEIGDRKLICFSPLTKQAAAVQGFAL